MCADIAGMTSIRGVGVDPAAEIAACASHYRSQSSIHLKNGVRSVRLSELMRGPSVWPTRRTTFTVANDDPPEKRPSGWMPPELKQMFNV
jgi:hypothetical protein